MGKHLMVIANTVEQGRLRKQNNKT
jgi:hypothetical protein